MPTKAIPLDRFSREVTSAIAAVATDKFPLATPPRMRDTTKIQKSPAKIQRRYPGKAQVCKEDRTPSYPSDNRPYGSEEGV